MAVTNGRTRKRDSLFLSARLKVGAGSKAHDVRVRNLSAEGLMAEFDQAVETGTAVALDIRGLGEVTGTVAWYTHGRIGVRLDKPVDPARARKPVGAGRTAARTTKPLVVPAG